MKRTLVCCLFLFLCSGFVYSQQLHLEYYRMVNRAELAICDSNLTDALKLYGQAFTVANQDQSQVSEAWRPISYRGFSNDLLNAFLCAMDTRNYKLAEYYMRPLLARGMNDTFLRSRIVLRYEGEDRERIFKFLDRYPAARIRNSLVTPRIDSLIALDQKARWDYMRDDGTYMNDSIARLDQQNARALYALFRKYGWEEINNFNGPGNRTAPYGILLGHYLGGHRQGYAVGLFDSLLVAGMRGYQYHPVAFASLLSNSYEAYPDKTFRYGDLSIRFPISIRCLNFFNEAYPEYLAPAEEARRNKERAKIGLGTLADVRKKLRFTRDAKAAKSRLAAYHLDFDIGTYLEAEEEAQVRKWIRDQERIAGRTNLYTSPR